MKNAEPYLSTLTPLFKQYSADLIAVYIFGSVAEGTAHSKSDIDIAILPERSNKQELFALKEALYADLCRALKRDDVDLVVLKLSNNVMLIDQIIHKGCLIWEKDVAQRKAFEAEKLHQIIDFKEHRYRSLGV